MILKMKTYPTVISTYLVCPCLPYKRGPMIRQILLQQCSYIYVWMSSLVSPCWLGYLVYSCLAKTHQDLAYDISPMSSLKFCWCYNLIRKKLEPNTIRICLSFVRALSGFLSRFCPGFVQVFSAFCPDFIWFLSFTCQEVLQYLFISSDSIQVLLLDG